MTTSHFVRKFVQSYSLLMNLTKQSITNRWREYSEITCSVEVKAQLFYWVQNIRKQKRKKTRKGKHKRKESNSAAAVLIFQKYKTNYTRNNEF